MKIAIIGSGNVGKALASSAAKAGHHVTLSANDPAHAEDAARQANARAAKSSQDAIKDAELVVLAIPGNKLDQVVTSLSRDLDGKVVVDVTNRIDMNDPTSTLDGTSAAEQIQKKAPGAKVVKAFNYAFASNMADPKVDGTNLDAYVAGDDDQAKKKVEEFAQSIGFRPIDAGPLGMARALEGMGALIVFLQVKHKWPWRSGWKMIGPTGQQK
jgi:8-hydroxy-5-deazaflavin:NADPH oxidoreductase